MGEINIFLQHGWGFDHGCWQKFCEQAPADARVSTGERGYFAGRAVAAPPARQGILVTVAHSLGLHLLAEDTLVATDLLVVVGGFVHFHGNQPQEGRFSRRHVQRMLTQLTKDPVGLVAKFQIECQYDSSLREGQRLNRDLLADDLRLLDKHHLTLAPLRQIPKILVIHGEDDRIVPRGRGEYLARALGAEFYAIEGAGHGLIFTHADICWHHIDRCLAAMPR